MATREDRLYARYLIEERERFSEEALALTDDIMKEYIEKTSKRKAALMQEARGMKRRKIDAAPDPPAGPSTSAASSSMPAAGSTRSETPDEDSAPKAPVVRTSPRVKKLFVPPRVEAQSLFAPGVGVKSPKPVKVVPTKKRRREDVEESSAPSASAIPVSSSSATAASSNHGAPAAALSSATVSKSTKTKNSATRSEAPINSPAAATPKAPTAAETPVQGLSKTKSTDAVSSSSKAPAASTSAPHVNPKGRSRVTVTLPKKPTVALKKAPTRSEIAKARREREAKEKAQQERERHMNHEEYIAYLPEKFAKRKRQTVLEGVVVFYVHRESSYAASKITRDRLDIVYDLGADLVSAWDPERVTHIIVSKENLERRCMDMCGKVKKLTDIPLHIKSLTWLWVADCKLNGKKPPREHEILREAFPERVVIPRKPGVVRNRPSRAEANRLAEEKRRAKDENADTTDSSDDEPEPAHHDSDNENQPVAGPSGSGTLANEILATQPSDPLAEFYEQARYEAEDAPSGDEEHETTPNEEEPNPDAVVAFGGLPAEKGKKVLKGFQCDQVGGHIRNADSPNEDIIRVLQKLLGVHESGGQSEDHWRVISYRKAISALRRYPTRIKSAEEAERLHGVGKKTADKIMEILCTGNLERLKTERSHGHDVVACFRGIYSVGSKIAWDWYAKGLRTLDDVRERKSGIRLSPAQEIGLRYYDDLNERMPRAEAGEIYGMIKQRVLDIDPNLMVEIMGSYRRRKETCGDIDILITRDPSSDGKTHAGVLRKLLRALHADGILTEDLSMPHDLTALEAKYMGICRRDATSRRRRIDILTIPFEQWGGALLYFTGDDIFNRSMRLKANKMGMSLNQRGLYRNVIRDPSKWNNKLDSGELFASRTEKEIFDALGVPWQEPWERVRG